MIDICGTVHYVFLQCLQMNANDLSTLCPGPRPTVPVQQGRVDQWPDSVLPSPWHQGHPGDVRPSQQGQHEETLLQGHLMSPACCLVAVWLCFY